MSRTLKQRSTLGPIRVERESCHPEQAIYQLVDDRCAGWTADAYRTLGYSIHSDR